MNRHGRCNCSADIRDYGSEPIVINMERMAKLNTNFRTTLWTGEYLQVTLMSIKAGEDIGAEMHSDLDQIIYITDGTALVRMGCCRDSMRYQKQADGNCAIFIPAGTWHNIINVGSSPLKIFSVYAPPQHRFGTVHQTKEIAQAAEEY